MPPVSLPYQQYYFDGTPDHRSLVCGDRDGVMGVWDLDSGRLATSLFRVGTTLQDIFLGPNASLLGCVTDEGECVVWNLKSRFKDTLYLFGGELMQSRVTQNMPRSFSAGRQKLLVQLKDQSLCLVDVERMSGQVLPNPPTADRTASWKLAADGRQWAVNYVPKSRPYEAMLRLWKESGGLLTPSEPAPREGAQTNLLARPNTVVRLSEDERGYNSNDLPQERLIKEIEFDPHGDMLLANCNDGCVRAWNTITGTLDHSVTVPASFESTDLLTGGRFLFGIDRTNGYCLFDLATAIVTPVALGQCTVTDAALDPAGERLVTTTAEKWARVWSVKTGQPLTPPVRQSWELCSAEWSPDGKRIAMAGLSPEVRVWDASTGELAFPPLRLGNKPLITVTWSLDGRFLVARSNDNTVRVWDAATGEALTPQFRHDGHVYVASLAANNRLVTVSAPNLLRAWDLEETKLPIEVLADFARLASGRTLNASGMMESLKTKEQADLCRSLRKRCRSSLNETHLESMTSL